MSHGLSHTINKCMEGQTSCWPGLVHATEDRDNKWEVDYIMDSHLKRRKLEYLVHWKGYDNLDCMWEPKSNLGNTKDAICDFHESHSSAPCALSIDPADFLLLFQKQLELFTEVNPHCLPFNHLEVNLWKGGSVTVPHQGLLFNEHVLSYFF